MGHDPDDRGLRWEETSRDAVYTCPVFTAYRSLRRAAARPGADAQAGEFAILEARDWVTVVPVLTDDRGRDAFLMVRQYRHGIEQITLEFPAGIAEAGESAEGTARRELVEETGHEAGELELAATMGAAPAFMTNWCHVFVARGLRRTRELALDATERLDPAVVPVDEVIGAMGTGELVNSITAMSLFCYLRHAGWAPVSR